MFTTNRRNRSAAIVVIAILAAGMLALAPGQAGAASGATIGLSTAAGPPTTKTKVSGSGFGAAETVQLSFESAPLGTATTNGSGGLLKSVTIPAAAPSGPHTIRAVGLSTGRSAKATFIVRVDSPQVQGDAAHDGYNRYENDLNSLNVSGLNNRCTAETGGAITGLVVAGGLMFVTSTAGGLTAYDPATCDQVWRFDTGGPIDGAAAIDAGRAFVASEDGSLYAIDANKGTLMWSQPTGSPLHESPVVFGGSVYEVGLLLCNGLNSYSEKTGKQQWADVLTGDLTAPAAFATKSGPRLYAGNDQGTVYALNATTGATVWQSAAGATIDASPSVGGGSSNPVVYVTTNGKGLNSFTGFDGLTGKTSFTTGLIAGSSSTPVVAPGVEYVPDWGGHVSAFNPAGGLLWETVVDAPVGSSLTVANGVVYGSGDEIGLLKCNGFALDADTGAMLWDSDGQPTTVSPVVVNGAFLLGLSDGTVMVMTT